jgi:hypothetical protein
MNLKKKREGGKEGGRAGSTFAIIWKTEEEKTKIRKTEKKRAKKTFKVTVRIILG